MDRIRRRAARASLQRRADFGFSLVELLIVIAVLGVLAAIAVPSYAGLQRGAKDASVQADLENARKALVVAGTDHGGDAPASVARSGAAVYGADRVDLTRYGWTVGENTVDLAFSRSAGSWCVLGTSSTGTTYAITDRGPMIKTTSCPR